MTDHPKPIARYAARKLGIADHSIVDTETGIVFIVASRIHAERITDLLNGQDARIAELERLLEPAAFAVRYTEPDEGCDAPNWVGIWNEHHIAEDMRRRTTKKREPVEVVAVCIRPLE